MKTLLILRVLAAGMSALTLGGCNDVVHVCPDVRNENPSLLVGRTSGELWAEADAKKAEAARAGAADCR